MSTKDKNTQAEYDYLTSTIKRHTLSGNYTRVVSFTNNITAANQTHFSYVPVVFEFVKQLLRETQVTGLIFRPDTDRQMVAGVYYPITHEVIRGVIVSLPTLTNHADEMTLVMVSHEGHVIGIVSPYRTKKLLTVDPKDMVTTILSTEQLDRYTELFTLLGSMKTFTKMFAYPLDATSMDDDILTSQLTDLQ